MMKTGFVGGPAVFPEENERDELTSSSDSESEEQKKSIERLPEVTPPVNFRCLPEPE
ncbi:unnamed protein product, partial [Gongylonema pulchrum]|uniref:GAGE domain-containing protein n=1 Tax=Gongylonema pulchrum TaxID=637853 RepID=A0A183EIL1_9BILA